AFCHAVSGNPACVYDALLNHKSSLDKYGDEIAWHYHHADWTDIMGTGDSCWNQLLTFNSTGYMHGSDIEIAERSLNYMLLKRGFFPCSFRSGWTWENNDFSNWLENIMPFDFSANPGYKNEPGKDRCRRNVNDWLRAPRTYSGYHPACSDFQTRGTMKRVIFRTNEFKGRSGYRQMRDIINKAVKGEDQLVCITTHSYNDIRKYIDDILPDILAYCDSLYISVQFQTASEAAASTQGTGSLAGPEIEVERHNDSLIISVHEDIFQNAPYCAIEHSSGSVSRIYPQQMKDREWVVWLNDAEELAFACAVSSLNGQTSVVKLNLCREK
ncbi:MAG: hypothetical protein AB1746_02490, partial [Candidatus Zixiibacteriota bacterium]